MEKLQLVETMFMERAIEARKTKAGEAYVEVPSFGPGDTVNIAVRVVEGDKEGIQNYQGIVIARRGAGVNESFRVRKISNGVGVERVFPIFSPMIQSITIVRKGSVRRAKLFYLRGMSERKIRQKIK